MEGEQAVIQCDIGLREPLLSAYIVNLHILIELCYLIKSSHKTSDMSFPLSLCHKPSSQALPTASAFSLPSHPVCGRFI